MIKSYLIVLAAFLANCSIIEAFCPCNYVQNLCRLSTDHLKSFLLLAAQSVGRELPNQSKSNHPPQTQD